jgi:hypothetical protein
MEVSGPEIRILKDGPFWRVRVEPRDALPDHILVSETHAGLLSANIAARVLSNATGFPVVDRTKGA